MGCWTHINGVVVLYGRSIKEEGFRRFIGGGAEVPGVRYVHYINLSAFWDNCFNVTPRNPIGSFRPCIGLEDGSEEEVEILSTEIAFPFRDIDNLSGEILFNTVCIPNNNLGADYVLTYTGSFEGVADIDALEKWVRMIEEMFMVRSACFVVTDNESHFGKPVVIGGGVCSF